MVRNLTLTLLAALVLGASEAQAVPMMFLDVAGEGSDAVVDLGETFVVEVFLTDLPPGASGNGLFGFGFDIRFAEGSFQAATPVAEGSWTGSQGTRVSASSSGMIANRAGETCGPFGTNCSLGTGVVRVATVELTALLPGRDQDLDLSHFTAAGDTIGFDFTIFDEDLSFFAGAVVRVVPEPAGLLLAMLAGLVAVIAEHRR